LWKCKELSGGHMKSIGRKGTPEPCFNYWNHCNVKQPLTTPFVNSPLVDESCQWEKEASYGKDYYCGFAETDPKRIKNADSVDFFNHKNILKKCKKEKPCWNCPSSVPKTEEKKEDKCPYIKIENGHEYCRHPNPTFSDDTNQILDGICKGDCSACIRTHDKYDGQKFCDQEVWENGRWVCKSPNKPTDPSHIKNNESGSKHRCGEHGYRNELCKYHPNFKKAEPVKSYGFFCSHNYKLGDRHYCDHKNGLINTEGPFAYEGEHHSEISCTLDNGGCNKCKVYQAEHASPKPKEDTLCQYSVTRNGHKYCGHPNSQHPTIALDDEVNYKYCVGDKSNCIKQYDEMTKPKVGIDFTADHLMFDECANFKTPVGYTPAMTNLSDFFTIIDKDVKLMAKRITEQIETITECASCGYKEAYVMDATYCRKCGVKIEPPKKKEPLKLLKPELIAISEEEYELIGSTKAHICGEEVYIKNCI